MLEVTGERLLPEQQRGELVHAEHLARYRFAAQLVRGKRVLDAASGEGYGTAMLAGAGAASATGVELEARWSRTRGEKYGLEFVQGDVCALPFDDASFDIVVSFETIEHVADPAKAVAEFKRVLAPGGLLVISTPNKREFLVGNEFHEREFDPGRVLDPPRRHFSDVRFAYQQNWLLSAVLGREQFSLRRRRTPARPRAHEDDRLRARAGALHDRRLRGTGRSSPRTSVSRPASSRLTSCSSGSSVPRKRSAS